MKKHWDVVRREMGSTLELSQNIVKSNSDLHMALINLKIIGAQISGDAAKGITPIAAYIEKVLTDINEKIDNHKNNNSKNVHSSVIELDKYFEEELNCTLPETLKYKK
jgi:hypothetical protein